MENNKKENFKQYNPYNFNQTTEQDVGIIEYINKQDEAFECVLKHRYSDFIVNEISENGNVIWLKTNKSSDNTIKLDVEQENEATIKNQNKQNIEDSNTKEKKSEVNPNDIANKDKEQTINQANNKKSYAVKQELVEDIINKYFVGPQIIDEEDGAKLKQLVIKYNDRYLFYFWTF